MLNFTLNGALRNACTRSLKEWPQLDQPPGAGAIRLTPEHNLRAGFKRLWIGTGSLLSRPLTAQSSDPVPQRDVGLSFTLRPRR